LEAEAMPGNVLSRRAEQRALRAKMHAMGLGREQIAAEFARRYRMRPRAAWLSACGWTLAEAAQKINSYTGEIGLDPGGAAAMTGSHLCEYVNWPGEGVKPTGRKPTPYILALLARVCGTDVASLLDLADLEQLPPADLLVIDTYCRREAGRKDAAADAVPPAARVLQLPRPDTAHGPRSSGPGGSTGQEVLVAAHEGSDHAQRAERREIGDAALQQLRADVVRLSHECLTGDPLPLFQEMRGVRARIFAALGRSLWPRDATDLYFLAGAVNCLMANTAQEAGHHRAAAELARAGWAYAIAIGHRPPTGRPARATALDERIAEFFRPACSPAQVSTLTDH
jgi:hypothetical protein